MVENSSEEVEISIIEDNNNLTITNNTNTNIDNNVEQVNESCNPHNGCNINKIKYSHDLKFFVTHSKKDESIVGWLIDHDKGTIRKDKYFKYSESNLLTAIYIEIEDISDDKYILLNNYADDCHKLLDFSNENYHEILLNKKIHNNFDKGFFTTNKHLIMTEYDYSYTKIHVFTYMNNNNNSINIEIIHKTTSIAFNSIDFFVNSNNLLIGNLHGLISRWNGINLSYQDTCYLINNNDHDVIFNKDKKIVAAYYKSNSRLVVYSLERNIIISSFKLESHIYVKKLEFLYTKNELEFLLVIFECISTKNYEYKLMNLYNLNNFIDITDHFNDHIIENIDEKDILLGPILLDGKIIIAIKNLVYIKEFISKETLKTQQLKLKHNKISYIEEILHEIYYELLSYETPLEFTIAAGKSIKWSIEYDDKFQNINIKAQVITNESKDWITIDEYGLESYQKFIYCKILNNDDLILLTVFYKIILSFNVQNSKIFIKCFKKTHYEKKYRQNELKRIKEYICDNNIESYLFDVKSFSNLNYSYIDRHQVSRQPYKEMILYMLNDCYYLNKYGQEILDEALRHNNGFFIEAAFDSFFNRFKNDTEYSISLLKIIISKLPQLQKHDHRLLSKFFIQTSIIVYPFWDGIYRESIFYKAETHDIRMFKDRSIWSFYYNYIIKYYKIVIVFLKKYSIKADKPVIKLMIPFPGLLTYENDYPFWRELLYKPKNSIFIKLDTLELYKHWNGQVILDFKWDKFGFKYYFGIWIIYIVFLLCFFIASTPMEADLLPNNNQNSLLIITIILGLFHLTFEIRQFIWDPAKYITDLWNYFDLGAYFLPIITSILWLHNNNPPSNWLISLSNLLLDLKFMLFLRVFHYFGVYFAIMLGVAKKVIYFLVILFLIVVSFSHAFYILLRPRQDFTVDQPTINDDPNNPWNLVNKYYTYFANNNSYSQDSYFVQQPDDTTNMFTRFPSSLLAMYNFLAGDNGAFGSWPLQDDPYLATLVLVFSFIVVIYLMNLFIGLLSNEIEKYDIQEAFLAQKAKIIAEIELFYLLPNQRRWGDWFPDILAYNVPVDDVVKKIKEIDDSNEDPDYLPFISDQLRSMVDRPRPDNDSNNIIKHRLEQIENTMEIILKKLK